MSEHKDEQPTVCCWNIGTGEFAGCVTFPILGHWYIVPGSVEVPA
jgi:hypothetical protein